jgi:hypothetical protein
MPGQDDADVHAQVAEEAAELEELAALIDDGHEPWHACLTLWGDR